MPFKGPQPRHVSCSRTNRDTGTPPGVACQARRTSQDPLRQINPKNKCTKELCLWTDLFIVFRWLFLRMPNLQIYDDTMTPQKICCTTKEFLDFGHNFYARAPTNIDRQRFLFSPPSLPFLSYVGMFHKL